MTDTPKIRRLDCGCGFGNRPAKGYDAYADVLPPGPGMPTPYVQAPLEDMSCFQDKEFDFVRAHHCVEHCQDPDKACAEIIRVGKAGIISFPTMQAEVMFGRRDHNWFVVVDRGRLLFIRKRHPSYNIPRSLSGCALNVDFKWEGSFQWLTLR